MRAKRIGTTSVVFEFGVFSPGVDEIAAHGLWAQVYVDRETRRPVPIPDAVRTHLEAAVTAFNTIFVSGQSMDASASRSRYAVLNAFTDYVDHASYSRDDADRWFDSQDGARAELKQEALAYLQAL